MQHVIEWWNTCVAWWSGPKFADSRLLWGIPMLWWGRYGQMMVYLGAVMVVTDVIGTDRLKRAAKLARSTAGVFDPIFAKIGRFPASQYLITIGGVVIIYSIYLISGEHAAVVFYTLVCVLVACMIVTPIISGSAYLAFVILSRSWSARFFKTMSYLLVVIGSHFVLLAS
jgi:hypothetical protein